MDGVIDIFPKKSFKVILYICNHNTAKWVVTDADRVQHAVKCSTTPHLQLCPLISQILLLAVEQADTTGIPHTSEAEHAQWVTPRCPLSI